MKTIADVQAANGLWHELWLVAVDEAYSAKDSQRRMREIDGLPERAVVDVYFTYHSGMREWADNHVEGGTCEAGIHELRERWKTVRAQRSADRQWVQQQCQNGVPTAPVDDLDDWMAPFKSGPAIWPTYPPLVEGTVEPEVSTDARPLRIGSKSAPTQDDPRPKPHSMAVKDFFRVRVGGWPDDVPAPSEEDDLKAVIGHFAPPITRDEIRTVRREITPAEWRKQGPRRPWGEAKKAGLT